MSASCKINWKEAIIGEYVPEEKRQRLSLVVVGGRGINAMRRHIFKEFGLYLVY